MPRFFIEPRDIKAGDSITVTGEDARHISFSLRARPGEEYILCDTCNYEYLCKITDITSDEVVLELLEKRPCEAEPDVKVTLFQALIKGDKFDAVVEPVLLGCDTVEANVPKNYNITCLYGDTIGEVKLYGQGAGGLPTGNAIVQDIIDINTDNAFDIAFEKALEKAEIIKGKYYIRIPADVENYAEFIGDAAEKTFALGEDTVVLTTVTTPAKIHTLLDANKDKAIFIARYF